MTNANDVKICAKVPGVTLVVEKRVSSKGNEYRAIVAEVNGRCIQLGFFGDREELLLLKAGIKVQE